MKKILFRHGILVMLILMCKPSHAQQILLTNLISPAPIEQAGNAINIHLAFLNNSGGALTSATFNYSVNGGTTNSSQWNGNLGAGNSDTVIIPPLTIPAGQYSLCFWTTLAASDTICYTYVGTNSIVTPPYADDFESPSDWASSLSIPNYLSGWQIGTPNYGTLNTAHSGVESWVIGLDSGPEPNMLTYLYSPYFNFSSGNSWKISFWQNRFTLPGMDGSWLEYTLDSGATWSVLGTINDPDAINWYRDSIYYDGNYHVAWDSESIGWVQSMYNWQIGPLPLVQLRFGFYSDPTGGTNYGIDIDDFSIDPCTMSLSIDSIRNVSCFGMNDGYVDLGASNGVSPYIFDLDGNASLDGIYPNLSSGTYTGSVMDNNGCEKNISVIITEPPQLLIDSTTNVSTACLNSNGSACVYVSGGIAPYTYLWTPGALTTPCISNLSAGSYNVTVTDANLCSITSTVNVSNSNGPTVTGGITTMCPGISFCASVTVGTPPYTYLWSTGETTNCIIPVVSGNYTITVTDANNCVSIVSFPLTIDPPIQITFGGDLYICSGSSSNVVAIANGGSPPYNYSMWSNGNLGTLITNIPGTYSITVTDIAGCTAQDSINLHCDDVWPGDANYDGTANNLDLLSIGIGYGTSGPVRPGASLAWVAQPAPDWPDTTASNINFKHIDCNGDGIINSADTTAIIQNFGQLHPLRIAPSVQNLLDPYLYFDITVDTAGTSQQFDVALMFGTSAVPADSIYGLAFTVNYDASLVQTDSVGISFSPSWVGATGTDMIAIQHNDSSNGKLYVGMTRIDHNNTGGFGQIAKVTVVTVDNVSGRMASSSLFDSLTFTFSDVTVIDKDQYIHHVNLAPGYVIVQDSTTNIPEILSPEKVKIYPNPAKDKLFIKTPYGYSINEISITNLIGEKMESNSIIKDNAVEIKDLKNFSNGIYFLKIKTDEGSVVKKFSVMH